MNSVKKRDIVENIVGGETNNLDWKKYIYCEEGMSYFAFISIYFNLNTVSTLNQFSLTLKRLWLFWARKTCEKHLYSQLE